jgi:hypothetical protein
MDIEITVVSAATLNWVAVVIFFIQKLRPHLWAISRSSRKSHDFS